MEALSKKLLEKEVIFREDLEEIFGKRAWDPELTETPLKSTVEAEPTNEEPVTPEETVQPESGSQL